MSRQVLLGALLGLLLPSLLLFPASTFAQITFSNILETRVGKDPDNPLANIPDNRLTIFDQFNLDWFRDDLRLGLRFETYKPSNDKTLEFSKFTHRYAEWHTPRLQARVGNFEVLFGRGVVLRAFELPGVIREEFLTPQFGDSRDIDGVKLQYHGKRLEAVAVGGNPRAANNPPTVERRGLVSGGSATVQAVRGVKLGGEYLRLDAQNPDASFVRTPEVSGATLQLSLDPW